MVRRSILAAATLLLGAGFLMAQHPPVAAADSFGELDQELYVGAAAFRPTADDHEYRMFSDGYLYMIDTGFGSDGEIYVAPLRLPAGAQIQQICLYGYNQGPAGVLSVSLFAIKLVPAGVSPGRVFVPGSHVYFDWDFGHGVICTDPSFSYTYRETGDADGDGNLDHLAHELSVYFHQNDDGVHTRFGGVGVFWRRQVSPAPRAATFLDVPTEHTYFQFVEALAASGITAGCGGGDFFCVNSPLTRGQMAVFLAKALGLHWPY